MSAYVTQYSNENPEHKFLVAYGKRQDALEFEAQWAADKHCQLLRSQDVSVGSHNCDFIVVDMGGELFGIVCEGHPRRPA